MSRTKRILQTGTFDVRNYGDLLFPLIAEFRLKPWDIEILPVSPTGFETGWQEARPPLPFRAVASEQVDGVLIGGGNIVHANSANLDDYVAASVADRAYAELWLGATMIGAVRNIPVIWNAPGVLGPLSEALKPAGAALALHAADYLSVRDQPSGEFLGPDLPDLSVVPDTAAELARMWPRSSLTTVFKALIERKVAPPDAKFLAVHVKERSLDRDHAGLAGVIEQFAGARGLTPLLVSIGLCHGDHLTARRIARHLRIAYVLLDDPLGLAEIAAAIAHATIYVGASLHGYITSAAYDVPGVIVARPPLVKFAGFLAQIDRAQDLAADWGQAFELAAGHLAGSAVQRIPDATFQLLDAHWERVRAAIVTPARKMVARTRFLRRYVEHGMRTLGDAWLLEPISYSSSVKIPRDGMLQRQAKARRQ